METVKGKTLIIDSGRSSVLHRNLSYPKMIDDFGHCFIYQAKYNLGDFRPGRLMPEEAIFA